MAETALRDINSLIREKNIATSISEDKLIKIGQDCLTDYINDEKSRDEWLKASEKAIEMALLIAKAKTFPWKDASNVKFPLIATASMQFGARAYPTLVPSSGKIVTAKVIGADPDNQKTLKARRVEKHLSYQLLEEMDDWEEDMDRLLIILPICGVAFKKTFYSSEKKKNVSKLVHPHDLVVNYWAKNLEDAPRISELIELSENTVLSRKRAGLFRNVDYAVPSITDFQVPMRSKTENKQYVPNDSSIPHLFIEQHTWLDLDEDGYKEPYTVTFKANNGIVARITARYDSEGTKTNEKDEIISIEPIHYYTKFSFFPSPDGGFYDFGFGQLLGGINDSVDTLINQLVDSGTLNNLQGGWVSKSIKIKTGEQRFTPGEWKIANMTSDDLRKSILPLPSKEPSKVLFELLGLLIQSGKELASIAEIFVGKMPGQNTPAYTTRETVEQGMKLFTSIYKRVYRSLAAEFKKLFKLNATYLDIQAEINVMDEPISALDYDMSSVDISPTADPNAASQQEKAQKFSGVLQLMNLGQLDPAAVTNMGLNVLELTEQEIQGLARKGPPPPNPEQQKLQAEMQAKAEDSRQRMQEQAAKVQIAQADGAQKREHERQLQELKLRGKAMEAEQDAQIGQVQLGQKTMEGMQKMRLSEMQHQQKMRQMKEGGGPKNDEPKKRQKARGR